MGKILRCWHKLQCLPLRLSLLVLCAWAAYTVSTGFMYPSILSTLLPEKMYSRQHVNGNLPLDSKNDQTSEKHFQLVPKYDAIREKMQPKESVANKKNNHYETITVSNRFRSLSEDVVGRNDVRESVPQDTPPNKNKRLPNRKRSLRHGSRDKNYTYGGTLDRSRKINTTANTMGLNELSNESLEYEADHQDTDSSGRIKQARKKSEIGNIPEQSAIDWYKSKINVASINRYGLTNSSSPHIDFSASRKSSSSYAGHHLRANQETKASHVSAGSSEFRIILLWTPLYKGWNFLPRGRTAFSHCSQAHCEVTSDRNLLKDSHAVIFHIRTMSLADLPPFRLPHQKWIFFSLEPPPLSYFPGFHFMYGMFNWTMTYRSDSDIVVPYGRLISGNFSGKKYKTDKDWEITWKKKTRPVIWMVSHCDTYSRREDFVRQLQKFIDVDILGGCGTAVCLFNQTYKCLESFSRRYKFFLAFENSICDDYVTEKFFRALRYNFVPVVLGGANYKEIAPRGSYINAADFRSPEHLADHLHHVSVNLTLYRRYFKWKEYDYTVEDKPSHCSLCMKMHSMDFKAKSTYTNVAKWWVENSHCTKWTSK